MIDGYDCYQNALAERINGILKNEFLIYKCRNKNELQKLVEESIEIYNDKRPHLNLRMKKPMKKISIGHINILNLSTYFRTTHNGIILKLKR